MTTIMIECPECEGAGEIRHPRWGSRNCPSPEITCPLCRGRCEVTPATAEEWEADRAPQPSHFDTCTNRACTVCNAIMAQIAREEEAGEEPFF